MKYVDTLYPSILFSSDPSKSSEELFDFLIEWIENDTVSFPIIYTNMSILVIYL